MILIFKVVFILSCVSLISANYSYNDPEEWEDEYQQCAGQQQSPIDVSTDMIDELELKVKREPIKFENIYDTVAQTMILENDGHTIKLLFQWPDDEKSVPYVHGGPLKGEYITHSFQFRWGSDVNSGSGHHLAGKSFPMEAQVVHYNKEFNSYEEAESSKNGLVIYSLFYKIGEEFDFLSKIIEKLPEVSEPGTITDIEPFALGDYFDQNDAVRYIVYPGSLPYPPCYESVTWIIADKIIPVSEEQIQAFQKIHLLNNDDHNYRPLQPLNGRKGKFAANSNVPQ